jgi:hypothetical protein
MRVQRPKKGMHFINLGANNIPNVQGSWTKIIMYSKLLKWLETTWLKNIG